MLYLVKTLDSTHVGESDFVNIRSSRIDTFHGSGRILLPSPWNAIGVSEAGKVTSSNGQHEP
jgi:hypothetical protein